MPTIQVRSLDAKVALLRPDLGVSAVIGFALQQAVKEVARATSILKEVTVNQAVTSQSFEPMLGEGHNLLKVMWVEKRDPSTLKWGRLGVVNEAMVAGLYQYPDTGEPHSFSQSGGTVKLYPAPKAAITVRCQCSFVPSVDVDEVDVPEEAVQAIEAKAQSILLRLPGEGRDIPTASQFEIDYRASIGRLRHLAYFGDSGVISMVAPRIV